MIRRSIAGGRALERRLKLIFVGKNRQKYRDVGKRIPASPAKRSIPTSCVERRRRPARTESIRTAGQTSAILTANAPISKTLRPCREESVDFDSTENLYVEGDNLDVLKLLRETYLGKIKTIYIDPPHNTGNDYIYNDDFAEDVGEYLERSGQFDDGLRLVIAISLEFFRNATN